MLPSVLLRKRSEFVKPSAEGGTTKQAADNPTAMDITWIGRSGIEAVDGALDPCAYVARAYKETRKNGGHPPGWARKQDNGQWLFDADYIKTDARINSETMGIGEAADILGATRRAVQTWVDQGAIAAAVGTGRARGARRRILRAKFMRDLPRLRKRLETPAVLGYKRSRTSQKPAGASARPLPGPDSRTAGEEGEVVLPGTAERHEQREESRPPETTSRVRKKAGDVPAPTPATAGREADERRLEKTRAANAIEARLREARDARRRETQWESQAGKIAEKLLGAVFSNELTRVDALVMFNDLATGQGIPAEVRARIRRQYFGR